ncbi:glycosyltransferase involved in cell wall biosynthesis [Salinibacter ruber]|nr:glycosyltransferase involved in cell wall biosynthesis [Salinibacter ruber]
MHYTTEVEQRESEQMKINTPGFVVPNCMDFSEFDALPTAGLFRGRQGISGDAPLLLFLGRIEPRKGVEISLRAFAEVKRDVPGAQFVVAGPGDDEYIAQLRDIADDLRIDDATHFPGYVDASERLQALVDADVFILTSHTENFAMAAVEAMAAGTPVLLSEEVGVADDAAKAGAGVSVALNEQEVSSELHNLLADPSIRNEMGQRGPSHVRKTYQPDAVASQMTDAITELREKGKAMC